MWLSIKGPNGWLAWDIGRPSQDLLETHLVRAKIAAGITAGTPITPETAPSLHDGMPHQAFFARVQTRPLSDLDRINQTQVDAWVSADRQLRQAERVAAAARVVADLSVQEQTLLAAQLGGVSPFSVALNERK